MISSTEDMEEFQHAKLSQVAIDINKALGTGKAVPLPLMSIFQCIGLELLFYEYDSGILKIIYAASGQRSVFNFTNVEMHTLLIEINHHAANWGLTKEIRSTTSGSFLAFRKYGKYLHHHHVEGLVQLQFTQKVIVPAMKADSNYLKEVHGHLGRLGLRWQ